MTAALVLLLMLTPAEKRGREIYFHGGSATAVVAGAAEVPAASMPCASCHGPDRRGVAEGTVVPPDIRWRTLAHADLEKPRPRYDAASLTRAITKGLDSLGTPLSPVMPRYRMSTEALADLLAFLRRDAVDPGLTDATITIATSPVTRPIVEAYVEDLNAAGGIHGRTLALTPDPANAFAVVGASDTAFDPLDRVPVLTPFATSPSATTFVLYADLATQAVALSRAHPASRNVFIEHDGSPAAVAAAATLTPRDSFPRSDDDQLFLLGDVDVKAILERYEGHPHLLAAGVRAALPPRYRITRAAATIPADLTPDSYRALAGFAQRHALPPAQAATQLATYATLEIFTEALKRAGRDLTRESLLAALESLYDFPTGLAPPVTFTRTQHVGGSGAWVIEDGGKARYVSTR